MKTKLKEFKKYDNDRCCTPFWKGETVYDESIMFLPDENGEIAPVQLLYRPRTVISVRDSTLTTEYVQGVDYIISDGKLKRTAGSRMPVMERDYYYPPEYVKDLSFNCTLGNYIRYAPADEMSTRQVWVTYTHTDKWQGYKPVFEGSKLPRTMDALTGGKPLTIAFNGDSIMVGANSSGWEGINVPPYNPIWVDMTVEKLRAYYKHEGITYSNTAVGGMHTQWGLENVQELTCKYHPDLAVIGFGMNDGCFLSIEQYIGNLTGIIEAVRKENPDCEIILIATTLPNKEAAGFYQRQIDYRQPVHDLAAKYEGIAVCDMTAMHSALMEKKRFCDMTGNNINHPNDFLACVYAQSLAQMLIEDLD